MAEKWILASPEKWGKIARKMGEKLPRKWGNGPKMVRKWNLGPFFLFSGPCFAHFSGKAKIHLSAIFVSRNGDDTRSTGFQTNNNNHNKNHNSKTHLMQHLDCAGVVALLFPTISARVLRRVWILEIVL